MSTQSLEDIQVIIDNLFDRLEKAETGGEISQCNHALRIQITKKKQMGGRLSEREETLIKAIGIIEAKKNGRLMQLIVLIVAFFIGLYVAYKVFSVP